MMEWSDWADNSTCKHYEVYLMKDGKWAAYIRVKDADNFLRFTHLQGGFTTREEAKQFCEAYEAVGARE